MTTTSVPSPRHRTPPPGRSIGQFLCLPPTTPPYEDVDQLPFDDIRQDAALRAWLALVKLGKDIPGDPVAAFDAEPYLAARAYRWAYNDALKHRLGRTPRPPRRPRDPATTPSRATLARPLAAILLSNLAAHRLATLRDAAQEAALAAIEDDAPGEVDRLWQEGIPGLTLTQSRRVISLMSRIQQMKEEGTTHVPANLRQQLRVLRKRTGLSLSTDLL